MRKKCTPNSTQFTQNLHVLTLPTSHFVYSHFAYSHFAYRRQLICLPFCVLIDSRDKACTEIWTTQSGPMAYMY